MITKMSHHSFFFCDITHEKVLGLFFSHEQTYDFFCAYFFIHNVCCVIKSLMRNYINRLLLLFNLWKKEAIWCSLEWTKVWEIRYTFYLIFYALYSFFYFFTCSSWIFYETTWFTRKKWKPKEMNQFEILSPDGVVIPS